MKVPQLAWYPENASSNAPQIGRRANPPTGGWSPSIRATPKLSVSVREENPARGLYESIGFVLVDNTDRPRQWSDTRVNRPERLVARIVGDSSSR